MAQRHVLEGELHELPISFVVEKVDKPCLILFELPNLFTNFN